MAAPGALPCEPWEADLSCCDLPGNIDVTTEVALATSILWRLSGRRYGYCSATIRPCRRDECLTPFAGLIPWADWWGGGSALSAGASGLGGLVSWPNLLWPFIRGCGCAEDACSCTSLDSLELPRAVAGVTSVKVDGAVLDPAKYRVDDWRRLVRTDGARWPTCQDLAKADNQVGTWSVAFRWGRPVSVAAKRAVGQLAGELYNACNQRECKLPDRVTSITRQGVSVTVLDPLDFIKEGRTGLYFVDLWLKSVNPNGLAARSRVFRADTRHGARRTGT